MLLVAACSQGKKEVSGVSGVQQRLVLIECKKSVYYIVRITVRRIAVVYISVGGATSIAGAIELPRDRNIGTVPGLLEPHDAVSTKLEQGNFKEKRATA